MIAEVRPQPLIQQYQVDAAASSVTFILPNMDFKTLHKVNNWIKILNRKKSVTDMVCEESLGCGIIKIQCTNLGALAKIASQLMDFQTEHKDALGLSRYLPYASARDKKGLLNELRTYAVSQGLTGAMRVIDHELQSMQQPGRAA